MKAAERTEVRPIILVVSDQRERFEGLLHHLRSRDGGRLHEKFNFEYLECYAALKNWYYHNRGRFVSLIILDVDFSEVRDERKLLGYPEVRYPVPKDFDPRAFQGFLIYASLRSNDIDRIAPVVFIANPAQLSDAQRFSEFVVYPGYGSCSFVQESPTKQAVWYEKVAKSIDVLALQPLEEDARGLWRTGDDMVVGQSRKMAYLAHEIERIGRSDAIVLLLGKPGVGKELVANALHRRSHRHSDKDLTRQLPLCVNIAGLGRNLLEDELFGHERGAFTGAISERKGIFETARRSTVFLDEIGDIYKEIQLKLLRAMEYHRIKRLGSSTEVEVDIRIIASTNRSVEELQLRFRPDFYSRLVQHCIMVPSLKERWENEHAKVVERDIDEMSRFVLEEMNKNPRHERKLQMDRGAVKFLYQLVAGYIDGNNNIFEGNIRTLRNIVERAYERAQYDGSPAVSTGHVISTMGIIHFMSTQASASDRGSIEQSVGSLNLRTLEHKAIAEALNKCSGNQSKAARVLGIHRDTLRRKLSEQDS